MRLFLFCIPILVTSINAFSDESTTTTYRNPLESCRSENYSLVCLWSTSLKRCSSAEARHECLGPILYQICDFKLLKGGNSQECLNYVFARFIEESMPDETDEPTAALLNDALMVCKDDWACVLEVLSMCHNCDEAKEITRGMLRIQRNCTESDVECVADSVYKACGKNTECVLTFVKIWDIFVFLNGGDEESVDLSSILVARGVLPGTTTAPINETSTVVSKIENTTRTTDRTTINEGPIVPDREIIYSQQTEYSAEESKDVEELGIIEVTIFVLFLGNLLLVIVLFVLRWYRIRRADAIRNDETMEEAAAK